MRSALEAWPELVAEEEDVEIEWNRAGSACEVPFGLCAVVGARSTPGAGPPDQGQGLLVP